MEFQERINRALQEIRDLKTAQRMPSTSAFYSQAVSIPYTTEYDARVTKTITYADIGVDIEPLTLFMTIPATGIYLKPYDNSTQTQQIVIDYSGYTSTIRIVSTRKIVSIT